MDNVTPNLRSWAEIDLAALERNVKRVRTALPKRMRYIAVVKADAYGHGYRQTATRLMQNGVDAFAVANVKEAEAIREFGSGWPIIVLSPILPFEAEQVARLNITPCISSLGEVETFEAVATKFKTKIPVHLKIDTGMGRIGAWHEEAAALARRIQRSKQLLLDGMMTHFASADTEADFTALQRQRLLGVANKLKKRPSVIHCDNSAGFETFKDDPLINAVRIGRLQFGLTPYRGTMKSCIDIEPILSFYARIALIKELPVGTTISYSRTHTLRRKTRVAIISAGYADGIPTHVSNIAQMIIRGRRVPVLGRITMDMTMLDITDLPEAAIGDRVTIVGSDGAAKVSLVEFSQWAQSIPWEIVTSITQRVPRIYRMGLGL